MSTGPVFVDATGRRGRWIRRVFWALGALVAAYIAVVFLALIGPPSWSRLAVPGLGPVLPGPGAPGLRTATGGHGKPAAVLSPRPRTSPTPPKGSSTAAPTSGPTRPTSTPTGLPTPTGTASPRPTPTSPATGPPATPGARASQTPPGQASTKPTPHSTRARGSSPQPSPTP